MSYRELMAQQPSYIDDSQFNLMLKSSAIDIAARADAEIAALRAERDQWREELRIYRETESAECGELRELMAEARDCIADCLNAESNQRHSRAERADYYAALLAQVDAAIKAARGEAA